MALQEAWLASQYPTVFWNTSRLIVESQSVDLLESDLQIYSEVTDTSTVSTGNTQYFKLARALGRIRNAGVNIKLPDINKSNLTFQPNVEENAIYFGLSGITRVSDTFIEEIIQNRPYLSLEDFMEKNKPDKRQMVNLIKAGAFDSFGERIEVMEKWVNLVADTKKRVTMQNGRRLLELGLIPQETPELQRAVKIYNLDDVLRKYYKQGDYVVPDDRVLDYLNLFGFEDFDVNSPEQLRFKWKAWRKFHTSETEPMKAYIQNNSERLLEELNEASILEIWDKYCQGTYSTWEMEALSFYYHEHELMEGEYKEWLQGMGVASFTKMPNKPVPISENVGRDGTVYKKYLTVPIVGTAIGRDKSKNIVGLLTPQGFVTVNVYKRMFQQYDRQIVTSYGKDDSWFKKGTKLMLIGYKTSEDQFRVKTYKDNRFSSPIYKITEPGVLISTRMSEGEDI